MYGKKFKKTTGSRFFRGTAQRTKKSAAAETRRIEGYSVVPGSGDSSISIGAAMDKAGSNFKPAGTRRVIKPSPVVPSVGVKRIQAAVASVVNKRP